MTNEETTQMEAEKEKLMELLERAERNNNLLHRECRRLEDRVKELISSSEGWQKEAKAYESDAMVIGEVRRALDGKRAVGNHEVALETKRVVGERFMYRAALDAIARSQSQTGCCLPSCACSLDESADCDCGYVEAVDNVEGFARSTLSRDWEDENDL